MDKEKKYISCWNVLDAERKNFYAQIFYDGYHYIASTMPKNNPFEMVVSSGLQTYNDAYSFLRKRLPREAIYSSPVYKIYVE